MVRYRKIDYLSVHVPDPTNNLEVAGKRRESTDKLDEIFDRSIFKDKGLFRIMRVVSITSVEVRITIIRIVRIRGINGGFRV
jgi:hypothetical protein